MNSYCRSQMILLVMTGLLCLLGQGLGASIPREGAPVESIVQAFENSKTTVEEEDMPDQYHLQQVGDMILTKNQWTDLYSTGNRQKRTAAIRPNSVIRTWPRGIAYYTFASSTADKTGKRVKDLVLKAMQEISHYTCIKFEEDDEAQQKINIFFHKPGCSSFVGMVMHIQQSIALGYCRWHSAIVHELCHSLGMYHEQSRPDRDEYIKIHENNFAGGTNNLNFMKFPTNNVQTFNLPYDYLSLLHYGPSAFAKEPGLITIETLDPAYQNIIGKANGLSHLDIWTLNILYQCVAGDSCDLTHSDCAQYDKWAYVGKDCTCWCPGPAPETPVEYCLQSDIDKFGSLLF